MAQELCRAEIKPKLGKLAYIFFGLASLSLIGLILSRIPIKSTKWVKINIFDETLAYYHTSKYSDYWREYSLWDTASSVIFLIHFSIMLLIIVFLLLSSRQAKKCNLSLTSNGISGMKKGLTGSKSVELPFENITSIAVQNGLTDKIFGGETVAIASATGFIRFKCIQNASAFVNTTLEELKKFKTQTAQNPAPAPAQTDDADKLLKLKTLLDSGVLTPEEYEEKRKELVSRL